MNWIDRFVTVPLARRMRAYYEAAEPSRYRKLRTDRRSANAQNDRAIQPLRSTARHLDENFDIASGILDVLIANTVGTGIQPEPQVMRKNGQPADEVNRALSRWYDDWRFRPEVTWQHDIGAVQRMGMRTLLRDGEVFGNRIIGAVPGLEHGTLVPYSIEMLEPDFVPVDLTDRQRGIVQGIETNAWGRPRAYHVLKGHPGDLSGLSFMASDTKRVSADTMMHVAMRKRFHQLRGVSIFASVMNRLDDVKEIDETERVAAKVAASMSAAIKKGQPDAYNEESAVGADGKPIYREMTFEPGMVFDDLLPGEDIVTIDSKRPNNALIPFRASQLRAVASGTGASYSSISKDYEASYAAKRQELVEHYMSYQVLANLLVYGFCQPVWDGFVDANVMAGLVDLSSDVDLTTLYDCTHTGPSMPWVDPLKEIDAQILAFKWGFRSRSNIIRERGGKPDQVNLEILRDEQERERLGIELIGDGGSAQRDDTPASESEGGSAEQAAIRNARIRAV